MKKYKLIKKYPGSPEIGTVLEFNKKYEVYKNTQIALVPGKVENYPEFWQEVIEKKYEVLSVEDRESKRIREVKDFDIETGGRLKRDVDFYPKKDSFEHILKYFNIHSVKRISDGEVFTIGDKIKAESFVTDRKYTVIDEIYYNEHKQLSYKTYKGKTPRTFVFDEIMQHYKEPLFVTEDGVDIYEGDEFYYINKGTYFINHNKSAWSRNGVKYSIYFSTKEKAQEYIDENKPIYSKKQIKDLIDSLSEFIYSPGGFYVECDRFKKELDKLK